MRYLAAYVLGTLSGKEPTNTDLEKILSSVGIEYDSSRLEKVVSELKGKNVDELITKGQSKLSTVPMGGGGGGGVVAAAPVAGGAASPAAPAEEKKEEKKPEKEDSESDDDMGFGLFD